MFATDHVARVPWCHFMSLPLPLWLGAPSHGDDGVIHRRGENAPSRDGDAARPSAAIESTESERSLIARVRNGDAEALGEIVRATSPKLVSFAFSFVRSRDVAEDIVQDVFVAVWERRTTWEPASVLAYLLAAVRNRAFKVARARGVAERYRVSNRELLQTSPSPADVLDEADDDRLWVRRLRALREAVDRLTERQRTAYLLRYEQGLTMAQIAHVLGVGVKSAEQLVQRTVHTLRERLQEFEGSAEGD